MKYKKNNADVSDNIQLNAPLQMPNRLNPLVAIGKYHNEKLTWRKTQWQLVIIIKFPFPFTCGYFLSTAVLEP